MTMAEQVLYDDKLSKPLAYAALGNPHLCITQIGGDIEAEATPGFDFDNLFAMLKDLAAQNPSFRAALVDYVIELSQLV